MSHRLWLVALSAVAMTMSMVGPVSADHHGDIQKVSNSTTAEPANGASGFARLSEDGSIVVFASDASNLVDDDTNGTTDIFLYDTETQTTILVSKNIDGGPANQASLRPDISADGTTVAYESAATDLVADDTSALVDVFVYDRDIDTTAIVSAGRPAGLEDLMARRPSISGDGTKIAYDLYTLETSAEEILDHRGEVYIYDTVADSALQVNVDVWSTSLANHHAAISADGTTVAVVSTTNANFTDRVPTLYYAWDVRVYDIVNEEGLTRASGHGCDPVTPCYWTEDLSISSDGTKVAYFMGRPLEPRVALFDTTNDTLQVLTDLCEDYCWFHGRASPAISGDGTKVAFSSIVSDLVADDTNEMVDVFLWSARNTFDDDDDSIFEDDIEWLAAAGITKGCGTRMFCPNDLVTRGQMAAFLNRALNLPPTTIDFFTDDNDTLFETDINELAASGITKGCSTDLFCQNDLVTRGQMAAFLNRALNLPPTTIDFFTDDNDTLFETDINELAASGITKGCSTDSFCPNNPVTRGQMAAFLHRALN